MITFEKGGWGKHKSRGLRLKDIDEARADLIEEINRNDLISKEHKKVKFDFELHWTITYWNFCCHLMCFYFCFCFLSGYIYW